MAQTKSLEETLQEIEDIINKMDREEISLEESFKEYQKGMELLKKCSETIDRVEKKVLILNENGGLDEF